MIDIFKNFAGGNIRVRSVNGKNVSIEQEIRDTSEWWFYWCFGAETDEDGEYVFQFVNGDVIGRGALRSVSTAKTGFTIKTSRLFRETPSNIPFKREKRFIFPFLCPIRKRISKNFCRAAFL